MSLKIESGQMASYVLLKDLYDNGRKDIYYVLSKFIEDVIVEKNWRFFTLTEISSAISDSYGFTIPDFVIRTSIKKLDYINKENQDYFVDKSKVPAIDMTINLKMEEQCNKNSNLLKELIKFYEKKKEKLMKVKVKNLLKIFINFYWIQMG